MEEKKEYQKQYRETHKEEIKAYRETHKEEMKEYQRAYRANNNKIGFNAYVKYVQNGASSSYTPSLALIALVEEIGEVSGLIKKKGIYPDFDFVKKYRASFEDEIKEEMGDVLWQYVNLCKQLGLDITDIIQTNVDKLNKRHGGDKVAKDGGKR